MKLVQSPKSKVQSPEQELLRVYQEWRDLAEAEANVIQARNWPSLLDSQKRKEELMVEITRLTQKSERQSKADVSETLSPKPMRSLVQEIISIEMANARLLAATQESLQQQQRALTETSRNLHRVHQAYTQGSSPLWHSYS